MKVRYLPGQAHYFSERNDRENSRVALLGNELFLRNLSTPPDVGHFNVLQHSEESEGFVMIQLHREARKIAFAVADSGIGIYKSLASSTCSTKEFPMSL